MKKLWNPIFRKEDIEILLFLWRHRIATFQALKIIFYPTLSNRQAYDRLKRLLKGRYILINKIDGNINKVWQLDQRGFAYLKNILMIETKSKTYKPQSEYHDLLVMAAILGDWALKKPNDATIVTEKELMEKEIDSIPQTIFQETHRRPDGLWLFSKKENPFAVALEVEISRKSSVEYEKICSYYGKNLFFQHVIWIIDSPALAARIHSASNKYAMSRTGLHCFILKRDFETKLWQAEFINNSLKGTTVKTFLNRLCGYQENRAPRGLSQDSTKRLTDLNFMDSHFLLNFDFLLEKTRDCKNETSV